MWSLLDNSYQLTHVWDAWGAETEPLPPHVHTSPGTNTPRMESGVWGGKAFVYNWEDGHVTATLPSLHLFCGWWYQPKKLVFACPQLALTFVSVQMLIFPFVGNGLRWFSYHHNPSEQSGRRKFASLFHEYWLALQDGVLHRKKISPQGPTEGRRREVPEYFLVKVLKRGQGGESTPLPIKKPWGHK